MKKVITSIIATLLFMTSANAANGMTATYYINSSTTQVNVGGNVSISIVATGAANGIASNDITLNYDSSLFSYNGYQMPSNVTSSDVGINATDGKIVLSYTDMSGGGNVITSSTIATFNFTAKTVSTDSNGTFSYSVSGVSDRNADDYNLSGSTGSTRVTIHVPSSDNYLSNLSISNGTLSPAFSSSTQTYSATVDSSSTVISATASSSAARVSGTGTKTLSYGSNTFTVTVTSESGATRTYNLNISRPDNRNKDNTLKSLTVSNTNIQFSGADSYSATVPNDIASVDIAAEVNNSLSTVKGTGTKNLNDGSNRFQVEVTAENGSKKIYTVRITREAKPGVETPTSTPSITPTKKVEKFSKKGITATLAITVGVLTCSLIVLIIYKNK